MKIKAAIIAFGAVALMSTGVLAQTADPDYDKAVGKWTWEGVTVEVTRCAATEICAHVIAGDNKCGDEMIHSKIEKVDANNGTGKVCNPKDGKIYDSKITSVDADHMAMKGSADGTVAEGTFTRVK
jgi:uncharacterized protein (DUF2147 family)